MSDRLREAAKFALEVLEAGPHATLLMNVGGIIDKLRAALTDHEAEPRWLVLEITTAYEQGVGKGQQRRAVTNPYTEGSPGRTAWAIGYAKGLKMKAEQDAESVAYRATSIAGEVAYFGVESAARAWARSGAVEAVPLKHLWLVPKFSECGPECRQCGMLCRKGRDIDERFAGRLAVALECMTFDPTGFYNQSCALLDEYKAEWEKVNPSPPTFMGEVIPERRERLLKLNADRAEIAQKSRTDYSDHHGPDWTDRDGEYLK